MRLSPQPVIIEVESSEALDGILDELHPGAGVFALYAAEGEPLLGKTTVLRRRLKRLLAARERQTRLLNLRTVVRRIEYWPVASRLEMSLVMYEVARRVLPERYLDFLKLRMPSYVRLVLGNEFPRTMVTSRLGAPSDLYHGPFRSRLGAEDFEHAFLDLFQLRRCQEDLAVSAEHPGCIYGEMNMCLRPCQLVVGVEEYRSEAARVADFLTSNGKHLLETAEHARERLCAELDFEEAARQHKRAQRIDEVLKMRDDATREIRALNGVAVLPSVAEHSILLLFLLEGAWQEPCYFSVAMNAQPAVSIDQRLRELTGSLNPAKVTTRDRQEHLALFARWYYSSWRDGTWIPFNDRESVPWRRLVNAISRTASAGTA